jgi:DNA-binding NarL/FixJ family response regulator
VSEQTGDNRIRLVLLDGQALFRASLAQLLASKSGLEVVGECGSAADALRILRGAAADVVLLDLDHGAGGGNAFISAARREGYQGRFLILADALDTKHSALAITLGAAGIFLKSEPPDRLIQALLSVANGAVWFDQRVIQLLADQSADRAANLLPERDQRVLSGILGGLTNRGIGIDLGISEGSVKASVRRLFFKAGVRTRSQLVRAALVGSLARSCGARSTRS